MFTKKERSTFKYWFAHWCAFQMTALNLKCWKPHMLLHDWYKPWMKLFCDYDTVKRFHREHSPHHLEHLEACKFDSSKMNWLDMVIDWECSRFTKAEAPLNAYDTFRKMEQKYDGDTICELNVLWAMRTYIPEILKRLGLTEDPMWDDTIEFGTRNEKIKYLEKCVLNSLDGNYLSLMAHNEDKVWRIYSPGKKVRDIHIDKKTGRFMAGLASMKDVPLDKLDDVTLTILVSFTKRLFDQGRNSLKNIGCAINSACCNMKTGSIEESRMEFEEAAKTVLDRAMKGGVFFDYIIDSNKNRHYGNGMLTQPVDLIIFRSGSHSHFIMHFNVYQNFSILEEIEEVE